MTVVEVDVANDRSSKRGRVKALGERSMRLLWLLILCGLTTLVLSVGYAFWQLEREIKDDLDQLIGFLDTRLQTAERALLELDAQDVSRCDDAAVRRMTEFTFEHPAAGIFLTRPVGDTSRVFCTIHGQVAPTQHSTVLARAQVPDKPGFELIIVEHLWSGKPRRNLFLDYHGERQYNSVQIPLSDSYAFLEADKESQRRLTILLNNQYQITQLGSLRDKDDWGSMKAGSAIWPLSMEAAISGRRVLAEARLLIPLLLPFAALGVFLLVYISRMRARVDETLFRFHRALERDEFVGYFQPIVDASAGRISGCEVLLRWVRADGSVIPPGRFIPQLEQSELIQEVTQRLLLSLPKQIGEVLEADKAFRCGVNLVPAQLESPELADWLSANCDAIGCNHLALEITERLPVTDMPAARAELKRFKALGIEIKLDDAGTGYGGAAYLQELSIDVLKIDKLFVDTLLISPDNTPVLDAYIRLGQSLGLKVIAEGVETQAQSQALIARGVHLQQGFLFAKPLPAADFVALYRNWQPQYGEMRPRQLQPQ